MVSEMSSGRYKDLLRDMPSILDAIGHDHFYETLAAKVSGFVGTQRYLVIRYASYSKPKFFVNKAMTDEAIVSYLEEYYRIDPLLRMAREGAPDTVVTFDALRRNAQDTLFYDEMYRTALIRDELVFLLATIGGVSIALCVDRDDRNFSEEEVARARVIFPTLDRLHQLHLIENLKTRKGYLLDQPDVAVMILDSNKNVLFRNEAWQTAVRSENELEFSSMIDRTKNGSLLLPDDRMLHWEHLQDANGIAPNGISVVVEEVSPGYIDFATADWKDRFAVQHALTQREIDIVSHLMSGEPTTRIAQALGISTGTVRNHKHRLYLKLDITTERELFCMLFDELALNMGP